MTGPDDERTPALPEEAVVTAARPGRRLRSARRAVDLLKGVSPAGWLLLVALALYIWYFARLSIRIHQGLGTSAFDLGLYDQGMWLLSRFKAPFVTLMGRNLFGDHTSFILLPLVPLYWLHAGPGVLFVVQATAIAAGAIPVFLYARRRLNNQWVALLLAVVFLLHPALQWSSLEGFHPDAFLSAFLAFAIYAALNSRWRTYLVLVVLIALVKEDTWLVLIPLGAWVAWRRRPEVGLLTIAAAVVYPLALAPIIMSAFTGVAWPNAWRIPFGGVGGFLSEVIHRPGNVASYLWSEGRPWYVWQMTAPFAWAFLRLPDVALIGAVVLGTNVLSTFHYQHQIGYHYSIVVVPALALGTVHALGAMKPRWRPRLVTATVVAGVWAALLWGAAPAARTPVVYWEPDHPVPAAAREIMARIPAGASVSAHYALCPHLSHRQEIFMFPTPFRALLYGHGTTLEGRRLPAAETVEYVVLQVHREPEDEKAWRAAAADFVLVDANDSWELYRRNDAG